MYKLIGMYKVLCTNIFMCLIIALIFAWLRIILIHMETVLINAHAGQNRLSQENVPSLPDRELLPHFGQRGHTQNVILYPNHTLFSEKSIVMRI